MNQQDPDFTESTMSKADYVKLRQKKAEDAFNQIDTDGKMNLKEYKEAIKHVF